MAARPRGTAPWGIDEALARGRSRDLQRPPIAEINALAAEEAARGRDLVNLGQAVLGLPPPAGAVAAVERYLAHTQLHVYSPDPGLPEAREAVARFLRETKGIGGAEASEVMLTCGANQAFVSALLTVTRPGDEVITFGPGYFDHDFSIRLAGCVNREVPLVVSGARAGGLAAFAFDPDAAARAVGPRTRALVLVSPGNPTGQVIDPEARRALVSLCAERGLWLLSDETYDLLTFSPGGHVSPAALGPRDHVLVLGSFSKVMGLAAWRCGYLHGPAAVVEEAVKAQDALVVCAPVPAQHAVMGALDEVASYAAEARATLVRRRDALLEELEGSPGLTPARSDGATFVFAQLGSGEDDVQWCRALVRGPGVIAVPGSAFGPCGKGWVRLSYGNVSTARIREAGARLRAWRGP